MGFNPNLKVDRVILVGTIMSTRLNKTINRIPQSGVHLFAAQKILLHVLSDYAFSFSMRFTFKLYTNIKPLIYYTYITFVGLHKAARIHCHRVAIETHCRRILVSCIRSRVFSCCGFMPTTTKFGLYLMSKLYFKLSHFSHHTLTILAHF